MTSRSIVLMAALLFLAFGCDSTPTSLGLDEPYEIEAIDTLKPCRPLRGEYFTNMVLTEQEQLDSIESFMHRNSACLDWVFPDNVLEVGTLVSFAITVSDRVSYVKFIIACDPQNEKYLAISRLYMRNPEDPFEPKDNIYSNIFTYPEFNSGYEVEFQVDTVQYGG